MFNGSALNWSPSSAKSVGRYTYRVRACTPVCGEDSAPITEEVVPAPPTSIYVNPNPSPDGSFEVSWSASPGALAYQVEEKDERPKFHVIASGVTALKVPVTGKAPGTYQYRVRACLTACGNPSVVVTETVSGGGGEVPAAPGWITSNDPNSSDGTYTLSWQGNASASYWQLEERNGTTWSRFSAQLGSPQMTVYNRPAGSYGYRAVACNVSGCSAPSPVYEQQVTASNPPSIPSGLEVIPPFSHDGNYIVSWDDVPGASVSYRLEELSPTDSWHEVANQTTTSKTFTGRAEGDYQYRVKGCNAAGCSAVSQAVYAQVRLTPEVPVFSLPAPAVNGHLILNWSAPPTTVRYVLKERLNNGSWRELNDDGSLILTNSLGLDRGNGLYAYQVQACSEHCSGWSNEVSLTVSGSPFATMPAWIESSVASGTCIPFDSTQLDSFYTISWPPSAGAQTYRLTELNADLPDVVTFETTLSRRFEHRRNELPLGTVSTRFSYEVQACAGSGAGQECSLAAVGASTCLGNGEASPESAPDATAYDAFGKVRNGDYSDKPGGTLDALPDTLRGFTGHQHVDEVRLIHMNGRVYDYELGRFLSVDPIIQFPTNTQSMNPYSYIMNNPLSGIDPTGYANLVDSDVLHKGEATTVNTTDARSISKVGNFATFTNEGGGKLTVSDSTGATIGAFRLGAGNGAVGQGVTGAGGLTNKNASADQKCALANNSNDSAPAHDMPLNFQQAYSRDIYQDENPSFSKRREVATEAVRAASKHGGDMPFSMFEKVAGIEMIGISIRSSLRGGYKNMNAAEFAWEAMKGVDSLFFGPERRGGFGGTTFNISGAPPASGLNGTFQGGDINYINIGFAFGARGAPLSAMQYAVIGWNVSGAGTYSHAKARMDFATYGYNMWIDHHE